MISRAGSGCSVSFPDRPGRRGPARHRGAAPVGAGSTTPRSSTTSYRPLHWQPRDLRATPGLWTRRVTTRRRAPLPSARPAGPRHRVPRVGVRNNYGADPGARDPRHGPLGLTRPASDRPASWSTELAGRGGLAGRQLARAPGQRKTIPRRTAAGSALVRELGKIGRCGCRTPNARAGRFAEGTAPIWTLQRESGTGSDGSKPFVDALPPAAAPVRQDVSSSRTRWLGRDLSDQAIRQETRRRIWT